MDESCNPLPSLKYTVFGLGNKTYEFYNAVARRVDERLLELDAQRIVEKGEGDDDCRFVDLSGRVGSFYL